jgi:hypothetical protein
MAKARTGNDQTTPASQDSSPTLDTQSTTGKPTQTDDLSWLKLASSETDLLQSGLMITSSRESPRSTSSTANKAAAQQDLSPAATADGSSPTPSGSQPTTNDQQAEPESGPQAQGPKPGETQSQYHDRMEAGLRRVLSERRKRSGEKPNS